LANPRVERVRPQRMRMTTLGFAKPSIWVLDLANPRVERGGHAEDDGGDTLLEFSRIQGKRADWLIRRTIR